MTLPLPSVSDLETYMGMASDSIDPARGLMMLNDAYNRCALIANPLPAEAQGVVLGVAARAFANPEGITAETVGPYSVQRPTGGLWLSKDDKATLRRMAGAGGAFSIDTLPTGVSAVQLIAIIGSPTGGTFTLSFAGQSSTAIAYNASGAVVQAALQAIPTVGMGNVTVTGDGPYTVTFTGTMVTTPVDTIVAVSHLTGGTGPGVTVTVITTGVYAPGQNLPYWDNGYYNLNGPSVVGSQ